MDAMVAALARHVGLPMPPERRPLIAADLARFEAALAQAGPPPLDAAADALAAGATTARALTEACLARAEALQPALNAFLTLDAAGALAAADASDARRAAGRARGALDGVPVAHKDLFHRAGRVTTGGSVILAGARQDRTATVLARLDAAGAVELGQLHMAEFAAGATGHNRHYGDCHNPWDRERVPGGSSGGSAVAVACGAVYGSLGSDTGGSIRIPAHFNGVVGLRPTMGRVSRHGVLPRSWSADAVGPLARTAEDAAIILQAVAGPDPDDSTAEAVPVPDYRAALAAPLDGLRLGVPENFFFDRLEAPLRPLLDAAMETLAGLGLEIVRLPVPDPEPLFRLAQIVLKAEAAAIHETWIRDRPNDYDHGIREEIESGLYVSAIQYIQALRHRGPALQAWLDGVFAKADLLFTPVYEHATPRMADCAPTSGEAAAKVMATFGRCTRPFSYLGLPAFAVPCGFQPDGMPAAFQLVGRPFAEARLLAAGHRYQEATDWHRRRPSAAMEYQDKGGAA